MAMRRNESPQRGGDNQGGQGSAGSADRDRQRGTVVDKGRAVGGRHTADQRPPADGTSGANEMPHDPRGKQEGGGSRSGNASK